MAKAFAISGVQALPADSRLSTFHGGHRLHWHRHGFGVAPHLPRAVDAGGGNFAAGGFGLGVTGALGALGALLSAPPSSQSLVVKELCFLTRGVFVDDYSFLAVTFPGICRTKIGKFLLQYVSPMTARNFARISLSRFLRITFLVAQ